LIVGKVTGSLNARNNKTQPAIAGWVHSNIKLYSIKARPVLRFVFMAGLVKEYSLA
jgi:hypothetical protein